MYVLSNAVADGGDASSLVEGGLVSQLRNLGRLRQGRGAGAPAAAHPARVVQRQEVVPQVREEQIDSREHLKKPKEEEISRSEQVYNAEEIDALKMRHPNGLKYRLEPFQEKVGDENRLDLAHMIEGDEEKREKANFFACAICTMVVNEPMECKGCDSLFCQECLEPWFRNNSHCPKKCKGNEAVEFGTMHRFAKQELEALKFKCKEANCDEVN